MYKLIIKPGFEVDVILGMFGDKVLFSCEDENGTAEVFVEGEGVEGYEQWKFPFVERVEAYSPPPIDWEDQWESYGPGYKEGLLEVPIKGKIIKMKAGPGFGNLSHPTTRLVLEMMPDYCEDQVVLDIGTGSGILALAAVVLGAKRVYALDIDPLALEHAAENAALNDFEIEFQQGEENPELILLNMISSDQENALRDIELPGGLVIVSGVLVDQKKEYVKRAAERRWTLLEEKEKEGWLGLLFKIN